MDMTILIPVLVAYILACRITMRRLDGTVREVMFAFLNVSAVYGILFYGQQSHYTVRFVTYLVLILFQYLMLCAFVEKEGWLPWLAFFTPIVALVIVRYVPGSVYVDMGHMLGTTWKGVPQMIGISYLAFRSSRLVLEVRNGSVKKPVFWEYLNFCFFLPTMPVGPINTYANYRRGFEAMRPDFPVGRCALRILIGFVKCQFLGSIFNQLTYASLFQDDHFHHWIDLPVAILFFYLYLYCNFSGFCDMAIGGAGLIGIPVPENFDNPFAARNVQTFWNRWHITLSHYMRDMVFAPLSKILTRLLGPANINHAIALAIVFVFLLLGIWHGVGLHFAAYGLAQAFGLVVNHYYAIGLKKWLGRDGYKSYMANPWIHAVAVGVTFCYCAISLILFANTFPELKEIYLSLR